MIDIKILREDPEKIQKAADAKGVRLDVKEILELDQKYRKLLGEIQVFEQEINKISDDIHTKPSKSQIAILKDWKKQKEKKEEERVNLAVIYLSKLREIPNVPADDVHIGKNEKENKIIGTYGKKTKFTFTPKDHLELGESLDIIDVKRAAKVSGSRFAYLKGKGVLLEFALVQYAMDLLIKEDFTPIIPPVLINFQTTQGLGYWNAPKDVNGISGNEEYYAVYEPQLNEKYFYLIGTAEHAIVPMYKDETLNKKELPKRYVGFSTSFRREAGSYGKDTKGILRVHQFDKVEMVSFTTSQEDDKEHDYLLSLQEKLFQSLEIPYQVVKMCTGDLGFPAARKYDLEAWIPSENRYREVTSVSTTTDFQSRRLNIKYQEGDNKEFVHILNGTAFAIGRTIIAILENFQNENGSVNIPKVLHKYLSFNKISPKTL